VAADTPELMLQMRQALLIACPEEIAMQPGWISAVQVRAARRNHDEQRDLVTGGEGLSWQCRGSPAAPSCPNGSRDKGIRSGWRRGEAFGIVAAVQRAILDDWGRLMTLPRTHCKATQWFAAAVLFLTQACLSTTGRAGDVRIAENAGPGHVVLEVDEATLDQVLGVLAAHFEFSVKHVAGPSGSESISGRFQGSLDQLLQRVLRHDGYVIVRSPQSKAEISEVMVLDRKDGETFGTPTPPAGDAQAPPQLVVGSPSLEEATAVPLSKPVPITAPASTSMPQPPATPIARGAVAQPPAADPAQRLLEEIGRLIRVNPTRPANAL
jgi:hypothetical protein